MADTVADQNTHTDADLMQAMWGPYWINEDTAVIVHVDPQQDLSLARTTDGGATWTPTEIKAGSVTQVACWFDQETPGDTGILVHIVWTEDVLNEVLYQTIDISDGSSGTERTVDNTVTVPTSFLETRLGITKTVNGNLLIALSTQTEIEFYRSVDSGANWTDRADVFELAGETDWVLLFPANVDDGDACAIFWDDTVNDITVKMYDDSANTWSGETLVDSAAILQIEHSHMDAVVRHSDSHILLVYHSNPNTTVDNFRSVELTVDSIASPTVTAKTNLFTNIGISGFAGIFINQQNDDVYVVWLRGGNWDGIMDVFYKKSTDGMGAWESEVQYNENAADDHRRVFGGRTVGAGGGRYQPSYFNKDFTNTYVNLNNDVEIAGLVVGGADGGSRLFRSKYLMFDDEVPWFLPVPTPPASTRRIFITSS